VRPFEIIENQIENMKSARTLIFRYLFNLFKNWKNKERSGLFHCLAAGKSAASVDAKGSATFDLGTRACAVILRPAGPAA